jgi:predicted nucleotide-binding protein
MAKKKIEEPVYPAAPLVIAKDRFIELLTAQIEKGKELLDINVPLATFNDPYMGYARRPVESMEYDEAAEKDFTAKFKRWHDRNKEVYRSSFSVPNSIYFHDYEMAAVYHLVYDDTIKIYKEDISSFINQMQADIERVDLMKCVAPEAKETINTALSKAEVAKKKRVFVVHGHDTNARNEVELFVRSIGYEPIILCKRADMGDTIIEKIEREAKDVCYAIVIYTSCDLGKDKEEVDLKPRARQNVVFEHGFMCAHLGRSHVCALLEEGVEQPGDLKGVIYKPLDAAGAWKYLIADEMKAVGLEVDKNKI